MTYGRNDLGIGLQPCDRLDVAESLARRWISTDISPKALELVNMRSQQSTG